jgi:hypothetical protein
MTVYVDALMHSGWPRHGHLIQHCHVFSGTEDHVEFHAIAHTIGLKRAWFRNGGRMPHYDLRLGKRVPAIAADAVPVGKSLAVRILRPKRDGRREEASGMSPVVSSITRANGPMKVVSAARLKAQMTHLQQQRTTAWQTAGAQFSAGPKET